jgi:hypothetical protein
MCTLGIFSSYYLQVVYWERFLFFIFTGENGSRTESCLFMWTYFERKKFSFTFQMTNPMDMEILFIKGNLFKYSLL